MSKLVVCTQTDKVDRLLMLVPDDYDDTDVYEVCSKMELDEPDIEHVKLDADAIAALREAGIHEWREYWG